MSDVYTDAERDPDARIAERRYRQERNAFRDLKEYLPRDDDSEDRVEDGQSVLNEALKVALYQRVGGRVPPGNEQLRSGAEKVTRDVLEAIMEARLVAPAATAPAGTRPGLGRDGELRSGTLEERLQRFTGDTNIGGIIALARREIENAALDAEFVRTSIDEAMERFRTANPTATANQERRVERRLREAMARVLLDPVMGQVSREAGRPNSPLADAFGLFNAGQRTALQATVGPHILVPAGGELSPMYEEILEQLRRRMGTLRAARNPNRDSEGLPARGGAARGGLEPPVSGHASSGNLPENERVRRIENPERLLLVAERDRIDGMYGHGVASAALSRILRGHGVDQFVDRAAGVFSDIAPGAPHMRVGRNRRDAIDEVGQFVPTPAALRQAVERAARDVDGGFADEIANAAMGENDPRWLHLTEFIMRVPRTEHAMVANELKLILRRAVREFFEPPVPPHVLGSPEQVAAGLVHIMTGDARLTQLQNRLRVIFTPVVPSLRRSLASAIFTYAAHGNTDRTPRIIAALNGEERAAGAERGAQPGTHAEPPAPVGRPGRGDEEENPPGAGARGRSGRERADASGETLSSLMSESERLSDASNSTQTRINDLIERQRRIREKEQRGQALTNTERVNRDRFEGDLRDLTNQMGGIQQERDRVTQNLNRRFAEVERLLQERAGGNAPAGVAYQPQYAQPQYIQPGVIPQQVVQAPVAQTIPGAPTAAAQRGVEAGARREAQPTAANMSAALPGVTQQQRNKFSNDYLPQVLARSRDAGRLGIDAYDLRRWEGVPRRWGWGAVKATFLTLPIAKYLGAPTAMAGAWTAGAIGAGTLGTLALTLLPATVMVGAGVYFANKALKRWDWFAAKEEKANLGYEAKKLRQAVEARRVEGMELGKNGVASMEDLHEKIRRRKFRAYNIVPSILTGAMGTVAGDLAFNEGKGLKNLADAVGSERFKSWFGSGGSVGPGTVGDSEAALERLSRAEWIADAEGRRILAEQALAVERPRLKALEDGLEIARKNPNIEDWDRAIQLAEEGRRIDELQTRIRALEAIVGETPPEAVPSGAELAPLDPDMRTWENLYFTVGEDGVNNLPQGLRRVLGSLGFSGRVGGGVEFLINAIDQHTYNGIPGRSGAGWGSSILEFMTGNKGLTPTTIASDTNFDLRSYFLNERLTSDLERQISESSISEAEKLRARDALETLVNKAQTLR